MTKYQKLVFAFVALLILSAPVLAQINPYSLQQSRNLRLVLNAAQCANTPQPDKISRSVALPPNFIIAVKKLKRVEDLRRLVFILHEMQLGEAGLQDIGYPLEKCFFHTINLIAKKRTPEAQTALDQIRSDCHIVGDAGGSLMFKEICRKNKMKCLKLPYRTVAPHKNEYE